MYVAILHYPRQPPTGYQYLQLLKDQKPTSEHHSNLLFTLFSLFTYRFLLIDYILYTANGKEPAH